MDAPVLFTNNYPMAEARVGWRLGLYPSHHLYGTAAVERSGRTVVDISRDDAGLLRRLSRLALWQLGDLSQQLRVLRSRSRGAVVLAAEPDSVQLLLLLRGIRAPVPRLVVVAHQMPSNILSRRALRGADRVITISSTLADELVAAGFDADRVVALPWGPDLEFHGYETTGDEMVLSTGKSQRDLPTLFAALAGLDVPATVYVPDGPSGVLAAANPRVRTAAAVASREDGAPLTYEHVLADIGRAAVIAVPLRSPRRPNGLTELNDALALGKPIVMTENPYIDCDIEAVGCGIWVGVGDVDGWRRALSRLMGDADLRRDMGARGRRWAEEQFNARLFGDGVVAVLTEMADRPRR